MRSMRPGFRTSLAVAPSEIVTRDDPRLYSFVTQLTRRYPYAGLPSMSLVPLTTLFASLRMTFEEIHAASGAAASGNGAYWSCLASPSWRCLRPSQMVSAHQIAPMGTATREMPPVPKPSHLLNE